MGGQPICELKASLGAGREHFAEIGEKWKFRKELTGKPKQTTVQAAVAQQSCIAFCIMPHCELRASQQSHGVCETEMSPALMSGAA